MTLGLRARPSGPRDAKVVIVGEAPGREEEGKTPFLGESGKELDKMLFEVGLSRDECFLTNVCHYRPIKNQIKNFFLDSKLNKPGPEITEGMAELHSDLREIKPNVIIPFGNTALWALTKHRGIMSWRGSVVESPFGKLVPSIHPAAVLRMWNWRMMAVSDLRRAKAEVEFPEVRYPEWRFEVRPTFAQVKDRLEWLLAWAEREPVRIAGDIETTRGHTACIGLAWSKLDALCIPFIDFNKYEGFFTLEEEYEVVLLLKRLLTHPNVQLVGQNFLYDNQYNAKHWGVAFPVWMDTMVAQHVCFPGLPKKLDFLSSIYCDFHQYWKDDGKEFGKWKTDSEWERGFRYNCRDCVATWELSYVFEKAIRDLGRTEQYEFQMRELYPVVQRMMFRGVHVHKELRGKMAMGVLNEVTERERLVNYFAERPVNLQSPKQLRELFYGDFAMRPVYNLKSKVGEDGSRTPSCDEDALIAFAGRERLLKPLCGAIIEARTLGNAMNVIKSPLDSDGRMRTSYNMAAVETFRFSSSKNPFGGGTNLQNITSGGKSDFTGLQLPNMRTLFGPSPGMLICEADLDRADLQVVVWESRDDELKFALRTGLDLHLYNARVLFRLPYTDEDLKDPSILKQLQIKYYKERQVAKVFCHATNYLGGARTVAQACGLLVHETERMQRIWFGEHPGIKDWHRRTATELSETRSVKNAFGYVRHYFDRIEDCLSEAIAWVPQSTVAIVINKIIVLLDRHFRSKLDLLLQVHDSTVFQYHPSLHPKILHEIYPYTQITVPYPDPLIIPISFKVSDTSWGGPFNPGLNQAISQG